MNVHKIKVSCGQIKFLSDFFKDYEDEKVACTIDELGKIDFTMSVKTDLSKTETADYLKKVFKQTKMGSALYFSVQAV
ncbi:hypothetical protein BpJC7_24860 [Weizmannia acidilactici]|uniref:Uncharacterized protein n=1 Tax=Weizmannia acidilactici TaxID=2607726 RepID=A0A5J4JGI1_9BACI|nr:hypothetical protein [Weizmannia acidilactici]GER67798.1 hypothetical protein BpJC4_22690 [Weizmannia acidilactici]GER71183.1 hypothetical protein BpJC7_24860 [Weizmannia acidilactici]GER74053.1 hypothetical protein BpPP18_21200 [Weizmannia acidilactici]